MSETFRILFCGAALLLPALTTSCGPDGDPNLTGGAGGAGGTGGPGGDATPAESCVKLGDKGNSKGVGEHCTPGGNECSGFPEAPACLASFGQDQWMCTRIGCDERTDCGEDAGCLIVEGSGSACIPCRCDASAIGCSGAGGGGAG